MGEYFVKVGFDGSVFIIGDEEVLMFCEIVERELVEFVIVEYVWKNC